MGYFFQACPCPFPHPDEEDLCSFFPAAVLAGSDPSPSQESARSYPFHSPPLRYLDRILGEGQGVLVFCWM